MHLASGFCYPISGHYFGVQSNRGGWALIIALLTPWLIGVYDAQGYSFFENFILRHNMERFSGNLHGHGGHPLYYLLVMPLVLLPYCGLVIAVLIRIREYWACPINRFALIWVAIVVILVSSSGTQLPHYILYSTAPLFVLYARVLPTLVSRLWALPGLFVPVSILGFGLLHHLLRNQTISGIRSSSLCCFS